MSLEKCTECGREFLTEGDTYAVVPQENYALKCLPCFIRPLTITNKGLAKRRILAWYESYHNPGIHPSDKDYCKCFLDWLFEAGIIHGWDLEHFLNSKYKHIT